MRPLKLTTTRGVQIGLLILLVICVAQISWWVVDEVRYTTAVHTERLAAHESDVERARVMQTGGISDAAIQALFPHLRISASDISLRPEIALQRDGELTSRINRFGWEGAFFVATLVLGMVILLRALRQQARLRQQERDFLAAVSHELKSPLASIRLAAETLSLRKPDPARTALQTERILDDVDRLGGMITNILETSRIDSPGGVRREPDPVNLREVLDLLVGEVKPRLEQGGVRLVHDGGAPELLVRVGWDSLRSVLLNLLDNAGKAASGNGGGEVRLTAARENGRVYVRVNDDGVGFPASKSDRIFEKFYRLGDEIRRTSTGSGLGLYLVRRIVENTGGEVSAHSPGPGKGAEFVVSWPAVTERRDS